MVANTQNKTNPTIIVCIVRFALAFIFRMEYYAKVAIVNVLKMNGRMNKRTMKGKKIEKEKATESE